MSTSDPFPNGPLAHRLDQLLYRCLEEVGSTKAALYLSSGGTSAFRLASHYGWPRAQQLPPRLEPGDPLVLLVRREHHSFVRDEEDPGPELHPFAQDRPHARFLISPIHDHGDWIGILLQRDPSRGEPYRLETQDAVTQSICQEIVQAMKDAPVPDEPRHVPEPPLPEAGSIHLPAPPTFPEQRTFFWQAAHLLCRSVPAAAVALWVHDPVEPRPVMVFSSRALSPSQERQIAAQAAALQPRPDGLQPQLLAKAERFDGAPEDVPFGTLLPVFLEEEFGDADLLMVFRHGDTPFGSADQEVVRSVAGLLGLYLEEGRIHERYHQSFLSVSYRILASAGEKLPAIRDQSVNTAELCAELARWLELPSTEVEAVSISAILHDVGTLLLDTRMLDKPELTMEDREKMQTHPILASTFLKGFHFPFDVLRIIRHHHEQWNGAGYPDGISGSAIPLASRIIHLVESYQVMSAGTSYHAPKSTPAALAELRDLAGTHFDPMLVDEFVKMIRARPGRA